MAAGPDGDPERLGDAIDYCCRLDLWCSPRDTPSVGKSITGNTTAIRISLAENASNCELCLRLRWSVFLGKRPLHRLGNKLCAGRPWRYRQRLLGRCEHLVISPELLQHLGSSHPLIVCPGGLRRGRRQSGAGAVYPQPFDEFLGTDGAPYKDHCLLVDIDWRPVITDAELPPVIQYVARGK